MALCVGISGLSDVFVQYGKLGRILIWAGLMGLTGLSLWWISRTMRVKHTPQGVAATIESAFPELDNHLINFLQFATNPQGDAFRQAYVRHGSPQWQGLDLGKMKNRKAHLRVAIFVACTLLVIAAPCFLTATGRTWTTALWRVINPFSDTPPISLTNIISVNPGNTTVRQGEPFLMSCEVKGRKGHRVWLDVKPSDGNKATFVLGKITKSDIEKFQYPMGKVTTDFEYRFRAGDHPFPEWYTVKTRPPLSFTKLTLDVKPLAYTGHGGRQFDGIADQVEIPQGAMVDLNIVCNLPLTSMTATLNQNEKVELAKLPDGNSWGGTVTVKSGTAVKLNVVSDMNEAEETTINYTLIEDRPPVIEVVSPRARTMLNDGVAPRIQVSIGDEYGLSDVRLESIPAATTKDAKGVLVQKWDPTGKRVYEVTWEGKAPTGTEPLAFRVVAMDNCPFGSQASQSSTIIFDTISSDKMSAKQSDSHSKAADALSKIIGLQKTNLENTQQYRASIASTPADQWAEASEVQKKIRSLTDAILRDPLRPLGALTPAVQNLYNDEMMTVVTELARVPTVEGAEKESLSRRTVTLEETILRRLTAAEIAAEDTARKRKVSGLLALLDALLGGQEEILKTTRDHIQKKADPGETLVERQDDLGNDTTEFVEACRREAPTLENTDKAFSAIITEVAAECESRQVKGDMMRSAEQLENKAAAQAVPHQEKAIATLKELQEKLNKWQLANAEEKLEETLDAIHGAKEKMDKLAKLQAKVVENMKEVLKKKNVPEEERDLMEEELLEVKENMKEAALQVPTDLHIFPDVAVANELAEDVYSVFEEVAAAAVDQEKMDLKAAEVGVLKDEQILDMMKEKAGRVDDMEMWLEDKAEAVAWNAQNFDPKEMPFMQLGPIETALEDLVGDLIEANDKKGEKEADDAATNTQVADPLAGWSVMEGSQSSFGAKGKSGNQTPDHSEQSGRSGSLGRQGMSDGESGAGSGTIGKGDPNIEERRTPDPLQSGQVQSDGEADTKATGGGKLGTGAADGAGMGGGGTKRMDSTAAGSVEGLKYLMAKTEAMHVKASLMNIRTESLGIAAHHASQALDAIAKGLPIGQVKEYQRRAVAALKQAQTELREGVGGSLDSGQNATPLEDVVEGSTDSAPAEYRGLVAEYFRSLNETR